MTPSPRKLNPASMTMAEPTSSDACTMIGAVTFGQMCTIIIRHGVTPTTRAAMMKSRSRIESVWPRTSLAKAGMKTMPIPSITLVSPAPRIAVTASASSSAGKA